ncbi:hypothetical protein ACIP8U_03805 [Streptomyces pseudovenezuelae]|uniref:hypothetical protein n=1 Tax=Streptomyces pseudovenezuelae TaxID=67350 RepID=UPI0037FCAC46
MPHLAVVSTDGTAAPGHAKRLQLAPPGRLDGPYGVMDDRRAHTHTAAGAVTPRLLEPLRGAGLGHVFDERTRPGVPGVRAGGPAGERDGLVGDGHRSAGRGVPARPRPGTGPAG